MPLTAQTLEQSKQLADSLFKKGLTTESIEIYDRIIYFSNDSLKPELYIKKAELLSLVDDNKQAISNLTYAYYLSKGKDSLQKKIVFKLSLYSMLCEDFISAIGFLEDNYKYNWYSFKERSLILGISYALLDNRTESLKNFVLAGYPELGLRIKKKINN